MLYEIRQFGTHAMSHDYDEAKRRAHWLAFRNNRKATVSAEDHKTGRVYVLYTIHPDGTFFEAEYVRSGFAGWMGKIDLEGEQEHGQPTYNEG